MGRFLALLYGIICYLIFLGTFLYAIWFVWTLDRSAEGPPLVRALVTDAVLLALFALQHSGMARQSFKRLWTKLIPPPIERSTYVLAASAFLLAVIVFWQPVPTLIWDLQAPFVQMLLHALFFAGWLLLLTCTFLIDHFDLFGVKQVWKYWRAQPYKHLAFDTPGPYKFVRHPLYLGFLIAFWSAPRMTLGHLFFSVLCTGFILVAIQLEERDLVRFYGEAYQTYRQRVSMLIPWPGKRKSG